MLIDFGFVRSPHDLQYALTASGWPDVPPEHLKGEVSPHTDVYFVGSLLHYRLTGRYLFVGESGFPLCFDAADANDDGRVNVADAITLLSFLFDGGSTLPPPYPGRGFDPTQDSISCSGVSS